MGRPKELRIDGWCISAKSRLNGNPIFERVLSNLVVDNVRTFLNYLANSLQNSTSGTVFLSFWGG